ncbi:hypothetical protein OG943_38215 [Amycolatopsis sp. NBC_00345]|uniref:hypothetical protein n=1 Tax=Amycolatopsis sp. NBC_00345 TaxID=2975955 RepID=UPI002E26C50E
MAIYRRAALAACSAAVAIASASAGFHELPNLFQLLSTLLAACLAALLAWEPDFKKNLMS